MSVGRKMSRRALFRPANADDDDATQTRLTNFYPTQKKKTISVSSDCTPPISRLVADVRNGIELPIPDSYALVLTMFKDLDHVVSYMLGCGKRIVFDDVRANIRRNIKRDFEKKHLGQIASVYPESYNFTMELKLGLLLRTPSTTGKAYSRDQYQLIIAPNLTTDLFGCLKPESPKKITTTTIEPPMMTTPTNLISPVKGGLGSRRISPTKPQPVQLDLRPKLEGWRMCCRAHIFRYRLVRILKQLHRKYLETVHITLTDRDDAELKRWHTGFLLDQQPDIPIADLPEPPDTALVRKLHARDYFSESKDRIVKLPDKVQQVIGDLDEKINTNVECGDEKPKSEVDAVEIVPKKTTLLERIRAKELARKKAEMLRDPVAELRKSRLQRLHSSLIRTMCSYYTLRQVKALSLNDLVEKLVFSYGSTSHKDMEAHIVLLTEIAPEIVKIVDVNFRGKYVRLNENDDKALMQIAADELSKYN